MALNLVKHESEEQQTATEQVVHALDKAAESDKPFLRQDEELAVIGDASKVIDERNQEPYELLFVFPKDKFETKDFEGSVIYENETSFTVKTTATQEPINANNRTFFVTLAMMFISILFVQKGDSFDLVTGDDLAFGMMKVFREPELVENARHFVGMFLGVDKELIPYINDQKMLAALVRLIIENPTVFNEAYFVEK